jgi:predicted nucleic acid-binding protein
MGIYADAALGFVDGALIALAERLNCTRIATLDRRHFTFVRPRHCTHFEILP